MMTKNDTDVHPDIDLRYKQVYMFTIHESNILLAF